MRHKKYKNSISLKASQRKALVNNLIISLIKYNRITTTLKKAKIASQMADKLITLAKRKDLSAQRKLYSYLQSRELVKYLVNNIAPRFNNRSGGYTRVIRYKNRSGDGALLALLEFTEIPEVKEKKKKKKEKKQIKKDKSEDDKKKTAAVEEDSSKASADEEKEQKEEKALDEGDESEEKKSKKSGFFTNLRGFLKK